MATYNHADVVSVSVFGFFDSFVDYQIHKWIEPSQNTNNISSTVQFNCNITDKII